MFVCVQEVPLFAVINGKTYQAAVSEETGRYQLSWSQPNEESAAQNIAIKVYDEDTYEQYLRVSAVGFFCLVIHRRSSRCGPV